MRQVHTAACYHNIYYSAETPTYKKDRESASFHIKRIAPGIFEGVSYTTRIALIDQNKKRAYITLREYSRTTDGQIRALLDAMPEGWTLFRVDDLDRFCWPLPCESIADFEREAVKVALDFLSSTKPTQRTRHLAQIHMDNIRAANGDGDANYKIYADIYRKYDAKIEAARATRETLTYEERQARKSEAAKERRAKYMALIDAGTPRIIARHKAKHVEESDAAYTTRGGMIHKAHLFMWDGKRDGKIKTTGGIEFYGRMAEAFANFEQWTPGDTILGRFQFFRIEQGETPENDIYIIGCHHIRRRELQELREIWNTITK